MVALLLVWISFAMAPISRPLLGGDPRAATEVLDTATPEAERLYVRTGWQRCGEIPDYALMPDGSLCETVVYWKHLGPPRR